MRLLTLPPLVQHLVSENRLSAGHARAIISLDDEAEQIQIAQRVVAEDLSVRDVERLMKGERVDLDLSDPAPDADTEIESGTPGGSARPAPGTTRSAAVLELERLLSEHLDTAVGISMGAKKGKIVIEYADLQDLERIYRAMTRS